jgi:hypothetical protein
MSGLPSGRRMVAPQTVAINRPSRPAWAASTLQSFLAVFTSRNGQLRSAMAAAADCDFWQRLPEHRAVFSGRQELGMIVRLRSACFGTRRAYLGSRMPTAARSKRLTSLAAIGHRIASKSCCWDSWKGLKLTATCRRGLATAARHGKFACFTPPGRVVGHARRTPPLEVRRNVDGSCRAWPGTLLSLPEDPVGTLAGPTGSFFC